MKRRCLLLLSLALVSGCRALPDRTSAPVDTQRSPQSPVSRPALQCLSGLDSAQVRYTPLPDRDMGAGCTQQGTVRIDLLARDGGAITTTNLGPVTCGLTLEFANWARYGVDRAARKYLGSGVKRIETMGSYACRNVARSGRRSAHARADAIDVSAFILDDGRRISVKGDWSGDPARASFLHVVHGSACKRFGTVLGPDYNADHADHLHLEGTGGGFCR